MYYFYHRAVDADITILNEVGVDPGIDHMLAMQCFDEIKSAGGKVECLVIARLLDNHVNGLKKNF